MGERVCEGSNGNDVSKILTIIVRAKIKESKASIEVLPCTSPIHNFRAVLA